MTQNTMLDPSKPDPDLLPSAQALARASAVALMVAAVLLFTVVLPAEAGIDPTGAGSWLGLTQLGELKNGTGEGSDEANPPAQDQSAAQPPAPEPGAYAFRKDELTLTLQPDEGIEVKAVMRRGDQLMYSWTADRGELFFDFHGECDRAA